MERLERIEKEKKLNIFLKCNNFFGKKRKRKIIEILKKKCLKN